MIGILSDSHDRLDHLEEVVARMRAEGVSTILHLGDYCAPFMFEWMTSQSDLTWIGVWGNNDGDKVRNLKMAGANVDIADGDYRALELEGRKLFLTHYPEIARIAALSGTFDAVFHGHTHQQDQELLRGNVLLANPGEIYGMRTGTVGWALYDPATNQIELHQLA